MSVGSDVRSKRAARAAFRGSQVIFGERRHLQEVLRSVQRSRLGPSRKQQDVRRLKRLIQSRTDELDSISAGWDRKFNKARDPQTGAKELLRLAANHAREDYLLARTLTEHATAPPELLESLAHHSYSAVRENVARHPATPIPVLEQLAEDPHEPLWFLVACNPSAPPELRKRLRERLRESAPE